VLSPGYLPFFSFEPSSGWRSGAATDDDVPRHTQILLEPLTEFPNHEDFITGYWTYSDTISDNSPTVASPTSDYSTTDDIVDHEPLQLPYSAPTDTIVTPDVPVIASSSLQEELASRPRLGVMDGDDVDSDPKSDFVTGDRRNKRKGKSVAKRQKAELTGTIRRIGQRTTRSTNLRFKAPVPESAEGGRSSVDAGPSVHRVVGPSDRPKRFPCHHANCAQICKSQGDLTRHLESRAHKAPSHGCHGCQFLYTRQDALKRHLKGRPDCFRKHEHWQEPAASQPESDEDGEYELDDE
jgi:hypothetical protein